MEEKKSDLMWYVVKSAIAIACTLAVGFIVEGKDVFSYYSPSFQFLVYGTLGSLFFFSLKVHMRNSLALLLVLYIGQCGLMTRSFTSIFFVRDTAYFVLTSAAVYVYFVFVHERRKLDYRLQPFLLAGLAAIAFLLSVVGLHLVRGVVLSPGQVRYTIFPVLENGFLIGLGIGVGILLTESAWFRRLEENVSSESPSQPH